MTDKKLKKIEKRSEFPIEILTSFGQYLTNNLIFDVGFRVMYKNEFKNNAYCSCPCSKMFNPLRKIFNCHDIHKIGCMETNKPFKPSALLQHMESKEKEGCIYHKFAYVYLRKLYNEFPVKGIDHYAFVNERSKLQIAQNFLSMTNTKVSGIRKISFVRVLLQKKFQKKNQKRKM